MKETSYTSFFTSVISLDQVQRNRLFFLVCIPTRIMVGLLFYYENGALSLSYLSALWGVLWLLFMIKQRRWEDRAENPWWWRGLWRISYRFAFSMSLLAFGFVGIVSGSRDRKIANEFVALIIWTDVIIGLLDKLMSARVEFDY